MKKWADITKKFTRKHDLNERVVCGKKHYTHDHQRAEPCQQCRNCGKFLRPEAEGKPCPDEGEECP